MRFYEPLVFQHVLDPTRGTHIQCEPLNIPDDSELDNRKIRHSFLNSLAYICDYERGGATVTALALETRSAGVVFWVVANENVKDKVVLFLTEILRVLEGGVTEKSTAMVEDTIFRRAVELGMPRVKAYWRFMQEPLKKCIKALALEGELQSEGELTDFLGKQPPRKTLHLRYGGMVIVIRGPPGRYVGPLSILLQCQDIAPNERTYPEV